ncbi:hypothetical protein EVAR_95171_1 [Eumeta japonica]|uniref:Uncharacterized protein n=1 Tax=Eumeta variegata TaxID=151549 RepID=A0A4C1VGK5_EUMVA|nr:hypothetical protein EVAR_95171_1 [Eumeta japonica]
MHSLHVKRYHEDVALTVNVVIGGRSQCRSLQLQCSRHALLLVLTESIIRSAYSIQFLPREWYAVHEDYLSGDDLRSEGVVYAGRSYGRCSDS